MNIPFEYNLTIYKGQDFELGFTYLSGEPAVPVNLTGYTARMQVRRSYSAPTVEINLTTENGGITLGGALGTIDLFLSHAATSALTATTGVYDLELVSATGGVHRFVMGEVEFSPEVTKPI